VEIKLGDLVRVVRSCCDANVGHKRIFVVDALVPVDGEMCRFCRQDAPDGVDACSDGWGFPLAWLKKIDPPSSGELKGVPLRLKETV